jgi:hypothetical protein
MTQITHTTRLSWTGMGGLAVAGSLAVAANAEQNRVLAVAGESTDAEFDLDFPFANLKSFFAVSTQDVTIETNDGAAPDDTITLKAGVPFWWAEGNGAENPFTADVASIFITNAGSAAAQVDIRVLYDSTEA